MTQSGRTGGAMSWEAISSIAELVGAVGVIISLIYIAFQIKQNTKASKAATRQALADGAQRLASDVVEGDDMARIMTDAMAGNDIKPHEVFRLQSRCYRDLRFWDNAYYQYSEGLLTEEEWDGFRENLKLIMQFPTYKEYWTKFQVMFSAPFRDELNYLLTTEPLLNLREALTEKKS